MSVCGVVWRFKDLRVVGSKCRGGFGCRGCTPYCVVFAQYGFGGLGLKMDQ